jgi:hypothetical protein
MSSTLAAEHALTRARSHVNYHFFNPDVTWATWSLRFGAEAPFKQCTRHVHAYLHVPWVVPERRGLQMVEEAGRSCRMSPYANVPKAVPPISALYSTSRRSTCLQHIVRPFNQYGQLGRFENG